MDSKKNTEKKYYKYKIYVKIWEIDFFEQNRRKPHKNDVKTNDVNIYNAYKKYWKIKIKNIDGNSKQDYDINTRENFTTVIKSLVNKKQIDYKIKFNQRNISISKDKDIWAPHLNLNEHPKKSNANTNLNKRSSFQLSQKMFKCKVPEYNHKKFCSQNSNDTVGEKFDDILNNIYKSSEEDFDISKTPFEMVETNRTKNNISKPINTFQQTIQYSSKINEQANSFTKNSQVRVDVDHADKNQICNIVEFEKKQLSSNDDQLNKNKHSKYTNISFCAKKNQNVLEILSIKDKTILHEFNECSIQNSDQSTVNNDCLLNLPNSSEWKSNSVENLYENFLKDPENPKNLRKNDILMNKNENFIRINLKKKVFVRGKKPFNFSKYKKNQWIQKNKNLLSTKNNLDVKGNLDEKNKIQLNKACRVQRKTSSKNVNNLPSFIEEKVSSNIESGESMEIDINRSNINLSDVERQFESVLGIEESNENVLSHISTTNKAKEPVIKSNLNHLSNIDEENDVIKKIQEVQRTFKEECNSSKIKGAPLEILEALKMFGHTTFRAGQEKAIIRILSGQSTLVTLATGSGKSLCYQIPAWIYSRKTTCISLVISPLISLMDDQISKIPNFLRASCIHMNQNSKLRKNILKNLTEKKIDVLLVSPETIIAEQESTGLGILLRNLPPIAFACIDEAHCISQWSHNFRPSYLIICKVLREKFGVKTFLGLTATASISTIKNVISILDIKDGEIGVISEEPLPSNLVLTISRDKYKEDALIKLLCSETLSEYNSIIIYCTRREDCIRLATLLRASLSNDNFSKVHLEKKNRMISTIAEAYHAGLSAYRRKIVQAAFMDSKIRIIVATVAFGMGINKSDIRSVIHFNMPASVEQYVQEIGRAGRDRLPAHCHLFLHENENIDERELYRHINANRVDRHSIRLLLQKIFTRYTYVNSIKSQANSDCKTYEIHLPIQKTVEDLDITEEIIATLFCYLEQHPKHYIDSLPPTCVIAKISSDNGSSIAQLITRSPSLAVAIQLLKKNDKCNNDFTIEISITDVASILGVNSEIVKKDLKELEWISINGQYKHSGVYVTFHTLSFRMKVWHTLDCEKLDELLEYLWQQNIVHSTACFRQLQYISNISRKYSFGSVMECLQKRDKINSLSDMLKKEIRDYFKQDGDSQTFPVLSENVDLKNDKQLSIDIRSLIQNHREILFTGRTVARIFHGISSPNFPALVWSKSRFWRCYLKYDFDTLCQFATEEILKIQNT